MISTKKIKHAKLQIEFRYINFEVCVSDLPMYSSFYTHDRFFYVSIEHPFVCLLYKFSTLSKVRTQQIRKSKKPPLSAATAAVNAHFESIGLCLFEITLHRYTHQFPLCPFQNQWDELTRKKKKLLRKTHRKKSAKNKLKSVRESTWNERTNELTAGRATEIDHGYKIKRNRNYGEKSKVKWIHFAVSVRVY